MFDDYVMFLVEALHSDERTVNLYRRIKGETLPGTFIQFYIITAKSSIYYIYNLTGGGSRFWTGSIDGFPIF